MDHQYCITAVNRKQEDDSVEEVSDGNDDIVMEEVHDETNLVSDEVLHHNDMTLC